MHIAVAIDNWLEREALFCNRYHARLTPAGCTINRNHEDSRCDDCGGLEEQAREIPRRELVIIQCPEPADGMAQELEDALQEVLEGEDEGLPSYEDLEELEEVPGDELTSFHHELLSLLEDDFEEPEERRPAPEKKSPRRFAVFMGRCPRCAGYMINDIERQFNSRDEDSYRCYSCGYRTSPVYAWNRRQGA